MRCYTNVLFVNEDKLVIFRTSSMMWRDTFLLCFCLVIKDTSQSKPNIILFLADDLGWNDVGFHGTNALLTPNIDALAFSGLSLHNYYVTPICTPSRAALMTGKYPIHTGMQHGVIYGSEPRGLPLSEKILPQYLKELGYKTHLVGKWHLGHYKKEYLPMNRGFDSHVGFWTGRIDMYDHTSMEKGSWGFDFRRGFKVAHELFGQYATDVYTNEAIQVINKHNTSSPLFLMVAHSAVHSGNPGEPIRAPDASVDSFRHIPHLQRQKFAAVVSKMDESIGLVMKSLGSRGLLENSIIIFSTDNGGPAAGFNDNAASNYPLRGVKNTHWEGGVRGAGVLWSPLLESKARVATQRLHLVDWLPTLLAAAGGDVSALKDIDGINQWEALSKDTKSERTTVLHNIDDILGIAAITVDQWKLIIGSSYNGTWDQWYGPDERAGAYNTSTLLAAPAAALLRAMGLMPAADRVLLLRQAATLQCAGSAPSTAGRGPFLYNIEQDPCEYYNLADQQPEILERLVAALSLANSTARPPAAATLDPRGDPALWGRVYTNFADYTYHTTCL